MSTIPATSVRRECLQQVEVAVLFEVAGEQDALTTQHDAQHDRCVVDGSARGGCLFGDRSQGRPHDLEPGWTERQLVALDEAPSPNPVAFRDGAQLTDAGAIAAHASLRDGADTVARHQAGQAAGVVLVRVRQDDEIDTAIPQRDPLIEAADQQVGIDSAVHEEAVAVRGLQQDRIALADIKDADLEQRVRTSDEYRRAGRDRALR